MADESLAPMDTSVLIESIIHSANDIRRVLKLPNQSPIESRLPAWALDQLGTVGVEMLLDLNIIAVSRDTDQD